MRTHKCCPGCSGLRFHVLPKYYEHHLYQCRYCKLVFSYVIPEDKKLEEHYEQYGRNDYRSPITTKRYRELLKWFEVYRGNGRILDLGCGTGYFLEEALDLKWEAHGIEISQKARNLCREKGIQMVGSVLDEAIQSNMQYDVITAFEVIEHLSHPEEEFKKLAELVRKGGMLYLTTPNFNSLNRRILNEKWDALCFPEHLSYFSKTSLDSLLSLYGFSRLSLKTEGISPGRLKSSITGNRIDHSSDSTGDEKLRKAIEGNLILQGGKKILNAALNATSLGESLKAAYIRS